MDRGVARRQAFLEAARAVFMEQGFEAASINEVVARAGGSLATLYAQFGSKEGLYLAVFEEQYARFIRDIVPDHFAHLPLDQGLKTMGEQYLRTILAPPHLAFYRVVVGGAHTYPQLLQRYLVTGLGRLRDVLLAYMSSATMEDGRRIAQPDLAASYFFDMLRSQHHYRALASGEYRLTPEQLGRHVDQAVQLLLEGALQRA